MNVMTPLTLSIGINASTFICMYMYYKKRIYILASNIMEIPSKLLACMNMNVVRQTLKGKQSKYFPAGNIFYISLFESLSKIRRT